MFKLTLVTPEKRLLTDFPVTEVFVPGERGELNILPGHAPLVTTLKAGVLRYREAKSSDLKSAAVSWGYCEVIGDVINILAETAEFPGEIDLERAGAAKTKAEQMLSQGQLDEQQREKFQAKLNRARVRLSAYQAAKDHTH